MEKKIAELRAKAEKARKQHGKSSVFEEEIKKIRTEQLEEETAFKPKLTLFQRFICWWRSW